MIVLKNHRHSRAGITLIEFLVIIGVISVLISLILPAVQAARETSRRITCSKNLGQLTLATLAFETAHGGFPSSIYAGRRYTTPDPLMGIYSPQCMLLPYLDQTNLYNSINFQYPSNSLEFLDQYHRTAATQAVASFLCPSDPMARSTSLAHNSYRACTGLGETRRLPDRDASSIITIEMIFDGVFVPLERSGLPPASLPLSAISDGLANTLAFSEKPIGSDTQSEGSPFRDWVQQYDGQTFTADQWASACSHLVSRDLQLGAGGSWMIPGAVYTHFYASAPPNTLIPDCGTIGINNGLGIFAARSYHPGGVNASMADGSVRWFSASTQVNFWRSLGTRAGGEPQGVN